MSRAFNDASDSTNRFGSALGQTAKYAALAVGAAGIGGIALTLRAGIKEFSEAAKIGAQTNAVLESTGGIANVTAGQVSKLAESLMQKSGVDDEAIQSGENMLLTFTRVRNEVGKGNDIFNQGTKAALNLSVALGKDMPSAAMLVGKALNDPIKGMTALTRAGIQFTDAQKKSIAAMVESGNVMGAQKVILAELNTQFGGSAEALGKTLPGQINILKESFSNMAGEMVGALVPAFTKVMGATSDFISRLGEAEGARAKLDVVWGAIKTGVATVGTAIKAAFNAIDWNAVGQTLMSGLQRAIGFLAAVNYGAAISAVAAKVWSTLKSAFAAIDWNAVGKTVGDMLVKALNALSSFVARVDWNQVGQALVAGIGKAIQALASFLAGVNWGTVLKAIGSGIAAVLRALAGVLLGIATALGKAIVTGIGNGLANLGGWIKEKLNAIPEALTGLIGMASSLAMTIGRAIVSGILSGVGGLLGSLKGAVESAVGGALRSINIPGLSPPEHAAAEAVGKPLARGVINGFLLGIGPLPSTMSDKLRSSLEAARDTVAKYQSVFADAFGKLGDFAKRAFEAKTQNLLDNVGKRFDAQIAKWQRFADALTPAEKALAELDAAEAQRSRDAAARAAADALAAAMAMEEGVEKERAIAAAKEQIRLSELEQRRVALQAQAEIERAAQEAQAAEHIAKLEAAKARELQNLEERRRQLGEQLDQQLAMLQQRLSKHPEEYDKIQKQIQKLLASYGVSMKESGELLGKAFARGLREASGDVESAARMLAKIVQKYLKLNSPAEKGPLSDLNRWFRPLGPMLAAQVDGRSLARAVSGMAGVAGPSMAMAGAGAAGGGGRHGGWPERIVLQIDGRTVTEVVRRELQRQQGRNG